MDASLENSPEQIINHPFHSQPNQMVLCPFNGPAGDCSDGSYCKVCLYDFEAGQRIYACRTESHPDACDFYVCIPCSSIKARVAYFVHEHPFCFLERRHPDYPLRCETCETESDKLVFVCVDGTCDFNLHMECGPLPLSIPFHYSGYDMTLTLRDALTGGVDAEDSWCDICEERRLPDQPVYHSSDPPFTVSVGCVLPQVVRALQGHQGEVELRRCSDHTPGVVLVSTQSSTDDDAKQVIADRRTKTLAADHATLSHAQLRGSMTPEDIELVKATSHKIRGFIGELGNFKFSDKAFEQFKEDVTIADELSPRYIGIHVGENPVYAKVGSNFVAPELVPLYRQLIDKHGDFTANSPLSPAAKAPTLLCITKNIQIMLGMRILHLGDGELCTWQWYFELVRDELGFETQFALDYLEKVARCWYALKFIKVRDEITANLSELTEELAEDINKDKPKLEELKRQQKTAVEGSVFGKQCFFKTSKLQWKSAGEFLGLDPEEDS